MAFDRTDSADLATLQAYMQTNYAAELAAGQIADIERAMNARQDALTASKERISAAAIRSATTYAAFDGLLGPEQNWLMWITGSNGNEEENVIVTSDLRDRLTGALGGSQTGDSIWAAADDDVMEPAMLALIDISPASEAEVLFSYGTRLSQQDLLAARDYTP